MTRTTKRQEYSIEIWAWSKMVSIFLDSLLNDRYASKEMMTSSATMLKDELDNNLMAKIKRLAMMS